jgi:ADP-ribosyl-[dinitrogen reductase] hydrolase
MSETIAPDDDLAAKVRRYRHLLPPMPAELFAHMNDTLETADDTAEAEVEAEEQAAPLWPALDEAQARDRALGCLLGLAVGDAIGAAVEFKPRDSFPPVTGMIGGGPFKLAPGEWTDDTTMALCLAETLIETGTVDLKDFMTRLRGWLEDGENTVPGDCFDIGQTTRAAIEAFIADGWAGAANNGEDAAGCGSVVRLAPLAIRMAHDVEQAIQLARRQSRATHANVECQDACALFTAQLLDALNGADKDAATRQRVMALAPRVLFMSAGEWRDKTREQIRSTGYVVHTLEAALWSIWHTDNFRDAVLTAANLGDDADSVAAVAGQLAGALYGASSIPTEWLEKLAWREMIEGLAVELFESRDAEP